MVLSFTERIRSVPVLRALVSTLAGIVAGYYLEWDSGLARIFIMAMLLFSLLAWRMNFFSHLSIAWLRGVYIFLLFFCMSWYNYTSRDVSPEPVPETACVGRVCSLPVEKKNSVLVKMKVWRYVSENENIPVRGFVNVYFQMNDSLLAVKPGDHILFRAGLDIPENAGNPGEFDYAGYLYAHRVLHLAWVREGNWKWLPVNEILWKDFPLRLKRKLLQRINDTPGDENARAVLSAIALGTRDYLDPEVKNTWANAGGIHVMAVSGLHVGMIWMVLGWLTVLLRRNRYTRLIRFLIIVTVLWVYAILTGLSSSVTRSGLMFSMVSFGKLINRNSDTYNTVLAAAFIQLWIKPVLFFDAGFRFSYLAVLGILMFHSRLISVIPAKGYIPAKIRDLTAVSLSAQFMTFPLGIFYFHQFPSWFLLTNFCIIPLVTILVMGYLGSLIFFFIPSLSFITTRACILVAAIMNDVVAFIERLPGALITGLSLNGLQVILLIMLPLLFLGWISYRKSTILIGIQSLMLAFILTGIIRRSTNTVENGLIIYNTRKLPAISIISDNHHIVLTDTTKNNFRNSIEYAGSGFWIGHFIPTPVYADLKTCNDSIVHLFRLPGDGNMVVITPAFSLGLVSDCKIFSLAGPANRYNPDFLVFTGRDVPPPGEIKKLFSPGTVILSSSLPYWEKWVDTPGDHNSGIVDVRRTGSFVYIQPAEGQAKK